MKFKKVKSIVNILKNPLRILLLALAMSLSVFSIQTGTAAALSGQSADSQNNSEESAVISAADGTNDRQAYEPLFYKDETVYGILDYDGSTQSVEIVSHLYGQPGIWVDYGSYLDLQNLTDERQPEVVQDSITWQSPGGEDLYYQGKSDKALPWKIEIDWKLDNQTIEAARLAGQSGRVQLLLSVEAEPSADKAYRDYFLMQIAVPLKMDRAREVAYSEGASQIVAGRTRTIAFTLLPGQSGRFEINFNAVNFEMDSIEISALPTAGQTGMSELVEGLGQIGSGQSAAAEGTAKLNESLNEWIAGLNRISAGLEQTQAAGDDIGSGLDSYSQGLRDLQTGLDTISVSANQFGTALSEYAAQGPALGQGYAQLALQLKNMQLTSEARQELSQLLELPDLLPDGQSTVELKKMAETLLALNDGIAGMAVALEGTNQGLLTYLDGAGALSGNYDALLAGIAGLPQAGASLSSGFSKLKTGYSSYLEGAGQLSRGLSEGVEQGNQLPDALAELATAQAELADGIVRIETEASSLLPDKPEVFTSFAAPGRISPQSLQFIMTTPAIAKISNDSGINQEDQNMKTSFWQRLTALFS